MKTDQFENIELNGFRLEGCWKELVSDLRKWEGRPPTPWRGCGKSSTMRPEPWEFTDYNEKYASQMLLKHKKPRRVG